MLIKIDDNFMIDPEQIESIEYQSGMGYPTVVNLKSGNVIRTGVSPKEIWEGINKKMGERGASGQCGADEIVFNDPSEW